MVNSAIEIRKPDIMYLINGIGSHLNNKQKSIIYDRVKKEFSNELLKHIQYQVKKFDVENHQKNLGEIEQIKKW